MIQTPCRFSRKRCERLKLGCGSFQEMATTPTTLEASRYSDLLECFPGNSVEGRDVRQTYLPAEMEGTPTYVVLPKELWTPEMHKTRCPVCRLEKTLYGHKNSGAYWQKFCNKQCLKVGFRPISDNWPCAYWNEEKQQFLKLCIQNLAPIICHSMHKLYSPRTNMC